MLGRTLKTSTVVLTLTLMVAAQTAQTIPARSGLTVRIGTQINSGTARSGDKFDAHLARDLVVNGKTVAKLGTPLQGKVTYAKSSGRLHAPGELTLRLVSLEIDGKIVPLSTSGYRVKGKSHTKSNATKIGGGAATGALLGAVFGGGKGALIGAAAGGAAGTGLAAATGKEEAVVPAESAVTFVTTAVTTIR